MYLYENISTVHTLMQKYDEKYNSKILDPFSFDTSKNIPAYNELEQLNAIKTNAP